jgi:hypothetical protein
MSVLKITTGDGSHQVAFDATSTLTVDGPDGHFSVTDVTALKLAESAPVEEAPPEAPAAATTDVAPAEPAAEPAVDAPAATDETPVTPDAAPDETLLQKVEHAVENVFHDETPAA